MSTESALAAVLNADVAALTLGSNLFYGPTRDNALIPDEAVFVLENGGAAAERLLDQSGGDNLRITTRAYIRSKANDYAGGKALADAVFSAGHDAALAGYVYCLAESSAPYYLGMDDTDRHEWSIIFNVFQRT